MTDLLVDGSVAKGEATGSPYEINSTSVPVTFDTVTLKNGGYIKITVSCTFSSTTFIKETGGQSTTKYDIQVLGTNGETGTPGAQGANQDQATNGGDARCDAAGGGCAHFGRNGTDGLPGNPGTDALISQPATHGSNAPNVTLNLGEIIGSISVLNQGGTGGKGGMGGKGGTGQQGGNGGKSKQCAGTFCHSGDGGKGGDGGDGGNGGNGGDGGDGGTVRIFYTSDSPANSVIAQATQAKGGDAGAGGDAGEGGWGGSGGGNNKKGNDGKSGNASLISGNDGDLGSFIINGEPVQT